MILIYEHNVVPIKIKRSNIIGYKIESSCISPINKVNLELIENNSKVYLKVIN